MRVLTVVGCRPQFIKAAPVSRALAEAGVKETLVHTGQHYDAALSGDLLVELGVKPDVNLNTTWMPTMVTELRKLIKRKRPDWVLVYGDTRSTLSGAFAADGLAPVAHVEAGMRCGDFSMPEERNRVWTDREARLLLCSDEAAAETAKRERLKGRTVVTGDVMADTLRIFKPALARYGKSPIPAAILLTIHRKANAPRIGQILAAAGNVDWKFVFPAHPHTRALIAEGIFVPKNVKLVKPYEYRKMLRAIYRAPCVVTDSGGLQKEAYWLRVPCITVRPSNGPRQSPSARTSSLSPTASRPPSRPPFFRRTHPNCTATATRPNGSLRL